MAMADNRKLTLQDGWKKCRLLPFALNAMLNRSSETYSTYSSESTKANNKTQNLLWFGRRSILSSWP